MIDRDAIPWKDVRAAVRLHYRSQRHFLLLVVAGCLVLGVGLCVVALGLGHQDLYRTGFNVIFGGVAVGIYRLALGALAPRVYFRLWSSLGRVVITLDDTGMRETADKGEQFQAQAFHAWSAVTKYKEDSAGFVVYFTRDAFVHIPKRLLTADEVHELRAKLDGLES